MVSASFAFLDDLEFDLLTAHLEDVVGAPLLLGLIGIHLEDYLGTVFSELVADGVTKSDSPSSVHAPELVTSTVTLPPSQDRMFDPIGIEEFELLLGLGGLFLERNLERTRSSCRMRTYR